MAINSHFTKQGLKIAERKKGGFHDNWEVSCSQEREEDKEIVNKTEKRQGSRNDTALQTECYQDREGLVETMCHLLQTSQPKSAHAAVRGRKGRELVFLHSDSVYHWQAAWMNKAQEICILVLLLAWGDHGPVTFSLSLICITLAPRHPGPGSAPHCARRSTNTGQKDGAVRKDLKLYLLTCSRVLSASTVSSAVHRRFLTMCLYSS